MPNSGNPPPPRPTLIYRVVDIVERTVVVLLAAPFLIAIARAAQAHPYYFAIGASELLSAILILTRKPGNVATSAFPVLVAFAGTGLPLLARPGGVSLAPELITGALMVGGLAMSIWAKLSLNRSFGLVAANRGVKKGGAYRVVRHPMYLGYIITQFGFLLASFSVANVIVYAAAWTFQILRIREEEKYLMLDPVYADYGRSVPRRLIPGLY